MSKQKWYLVLMWSGIIGIIVSSVLILVFSLMQMISGVYISSIIGFGVSSGLFIAAFAMNKYSNYVADKDVTRVTSNITTLAPKELNGGLLIYNSEETIIYISPWLLERGFTPFLSAKLTKLKLDLSKIDQPQKLNIQGHIYSTKFYINDKIIFVSDVTELEELRKYIDYQQKAVVVITEKYSSVALADEIKKAKADLVIHEHMAAFIKENDGLFIKDHPKDGTHIAIVDWLKIKDMMDKQGSILEQLYKKLGEQRRLVNISMGIAHSIPSLNLLMEKAKAVVTIAENRGGNQIVVMNETGKLQFIGKSSEGVDNSNRVEMGLYYEMFISQIRKAKNIIVSAHVFADLDALASALAVAWFIKNEINSDVKIVQETIDSSVEKVMRKMPEEFKQFFITQKDAEKIITKNTALVITDVSSPKRTQVKDLYNNFVSNNIFILDHHRMGEETILVDSANIYIDPTASSAAEIIVDLLRVHYNATNIPNFEYVATTLLSGVLLDTDRLNRGTSAKAFDAIAWLFRNGANREEAIKYTQSDFKEMAKLIAFTLENTRNVTDSVLFIELPSNKFKLDSGKISAVANELLNYQNIEATFVVAKEPNANAWKISARSKGSINVQLIMEKFGGGGHFSAAAALLTLDKYPNTDVVYQKLLKEFNVDLEKDKKISEKKTIKSLIKDKKAKRKTSETTISTSLFVPTIEQKVETKTAENKVETKTKSKKSSSKSKK